MKIYINEENDKWWMCVGPKWYIMSQNYRKNCTFTSRLPLLTSLCYLQSYLVLLSHSVLIHSLDETFTFSCFNKHAALFNDALRQTCHAKRAKHAMQKEQNINPWQWVRVILCDSAGKRKFAAPVQGTQLISLRNTV